MDPYTLLVITRTQSLAERLQSTLDARQYLIRWVPSTTQALALRLHPSLLILELPPSGGARSMVRLKAEFRVPLLALVRSDEPTPERADAALARPFEVETLIDLIQETLMDHGPHIVQANGVSLDTRTRRVQMDGEYYRLPPIGCRLLAILIEQAGCAVPRDELFRRVWRLDDGDSTRVLDVHIANLRRLLEADPRHPKLIITERGIGYRLDPPT
jgi:DNA-binding response OmpR family regulator